MKRLAPWLLLPVCTLVAYFLGASTASPAAGRTAGTAVSNTAAPAATGKAEPDIREVPETPAIDLDALLRFEGPTVVLFFRPEQPRELKMANYLGEQAIQDKRFGMRAVKVTSLTAPMPTRYGIKATPAILVYDRYQKLLGKADDPEQAGVFLRKALREARLPWVDELDPSAPKVYREMGGGKSPVPEIMKTMSPRPEWMNTMTRLSLKAHFTDGALPRRTKEMIASYESYLNTCHWCLGTHGQFLSTNGGSAKVVDAVAQGKIDSPVITSQERALLHYVEVLTLHPERMRDAEITQLRKAGWSDDEIFEATFDTALFAFYNRMANAYGLDYPKEGYLPPNLRGTAAKSSE